MATAACIGWALRRSLGSLNHDSLLLLLLYSSRSEASVTGDPVTHLRTEGRPGRTKRRRSRGRHCPSCSANRRLPESRQGLPLQHGSTVATEICCLLVRTRRNVSTNLTNAPLHAAGRLWLVGDDAIGGSGCRSGARHWPICTGRANGKVSWPSSGGRRPDFSSSAKSTDRRLMWLHHSLSWCTLRHHLPCGQTLTLSSLPLHAATMYHPNG